MKKAVLPAILFVSFYCFSQQIPNNLSPAAKVYGLSKFWQEVNYNFVYLDEIDRKAWDSTYLSLISEVQQTPNDYEYYRLMQKFCAMLRDGHTNVYAPGTVGSLIFGKMFGNTWFGLDEIGGKAIINRVLKSELNEIPIGTEVISVNGVPAMEYAKKNVEPYIASSTDYVRERQAVQNLLTGLVGASYDVEFKKPDGKNFSLHLTHERTKDDNFYPPFPNPPLLELKWYPGKIAYLALNSFGNRKIDSVFLTKLNELYEAKGLIIDLRSNGGGSTNIGTDILQYLIPGNSMQSSRSFTRKHLPAFKAWGANMNIKDTVDNAWNGQAWRANHDLEFYDFGYEPNNFELKAKRLVVPTAILTSNNTASAAEDFLIAAGDQKHMIRIGERTFGSTGQPYQFDLGNGFMARVCTKKDTWPDGSPFVGVGIKPTIECAPTAQDFIDNKDPVLERALTYMKTQVK